MFQWELGRAATACYTQLLQPAGPLDTRGLTERGVLQLLMDVRWGAAGEGAGGAGGQQLGGSAGV